MPPFGHWRTMPCLTASSAAVDATTAPFSTDDSCLSTSSAPSLAMLSPSTDSSTGPSSCACLSVCIAADATTGADAATCTGAGLVVSSIDLSERTSCPSPPAAAAMSSAQGGAWPSPSVPSAISSSALPTSPLSLATGPALSPMAGATVTKAAPTPVPTPASASPLGACSRRMSIWTSLS
eukprot:1227814-Prymnesium_polylepis.2